MYSNDVTKCKNKIQLWVYDVENSLKSKHRNQIIRDQNFKN